MKKLIFLIICTCLSYSYQDSIKAFMGIGTEAYGISKDTPIGTASRIHRTLLRAGLQGDLGDEGKPRTIKFSDTLSEKNYKDFPSSVVVKVGKDEKVRKITFIFISTGRGPSPQRMTATEQYAMSFWKLISEKKPKFERKSAGSLEFPYGISVPDWYMEADFSKSKVNGTWVYNIERMPYEIMEISL